MKMVIVKITVGPVTIAEFRLACGQQMETIIDQLEFEELPLIDPTTNQPLSREMMAKYGGPARRAIIDVPTAISWVQQFDNFDEVTDETKHPDVPEDLHIQIIKGVKAAMHGALTSVQGIQHTSVCLMVMGCFAEA